MKLSNNLVTCFFAALIAAPAAFSGHAASSAGQFPSAPIFTFVPDGAPGGSEPCHPNPDHEYSHGFVPDGEGGNPHC